jgi:C-terminal processing protease CtpA/Prc
MNKKAVFLQALLLIMSFILSACIGLIPLEEEPGAGEFGPQASPQEQQAKTFEALWKNLQENYIYFETARVDWTALHDKYLDRINRGLTSEEFASLIEELEAELPAGSLVHETRAERIERDVADTSSYEGIGAFVGFSEQPQPHIVLLDVIEGSPAQKAGLRAHDSIFAIDGNPIMLEEGITAVDRVRGPAGSSVTLDVQTPGTPGRSVEVQRGRLTSTGKLKASVLQGTNYGYLLFPPVGYDTLQADVVESMQKFSTDKTGRLRSTCALCSTRGPSKICLPFYDGPLGEFIIATINNRQERGRIHSVHKLPGYSGRSEYHGLSGDSCGQPSDA